jgi:hypothetical protein
MLPDIREAKAKLGVYSLQYKQSVSPHLTLSWTSPTESETTQNIFPIQIK